MHARLSKEIFLTTRKGKKHKKNFKKTSAHSKNQSTELKDKNMGNKLGRISFPNASSKNHCYTFAIFVF